VSFAGEDNLYRPDVFSDLDNPMGVLKDEARPFVGRDSACPTYGENIRAETPTLEK